MKVAKKIVTFLLMTLVCSSFFPVSSSEFSLKEAMTSTPGIMQAGMIETVVVESCGYCTVDIWMNVSTSTLVEIYKRAFGFNIFGNQTTGTYYDVPDEIPLVPQQNFIFQDGVDPYENYGLYVDGKIYPRDSLCNGIYKQQLLDLGIDITDWDTVRMKCDGSVFIVHLNATGYFIRFEQSGTESILSVGPSNWNISCDRASLVLNQIGFIQQMLGDSEEDTYHNYWQTTITTPTSITNSPPPPWDVDFGGGTYMNATLAGGGYTVVLVEDMWVSEENITKTREELLEYEKFLCYKIFNLKYPKVDICESRYPGVIDDLSWGFDLDLNVVCLGVGVTFSFPTSSGDVVVDLDVSFDLTLRGHVYLETKWFKFRKFEAWMQAEGMLWAKFNASYDDGGSFSHTWEKDLYTWTTNASRPYVFWIGPVLIVVRPRLRVIGRLTVDIHGDIWISCEAQTDGFIRLGVGWKRGKGFYGIFNADMGVTEFSPQVGGVEDVTVTPSMGFRPSLLFYEMVGPAAEIEPYLQVHWYDDGSGWKNDTLLGLNASVGIDFSGWIKKITGLRDYDWTLLNMVLWEHPDRKPRDVAVTDIRIPKKVVYGDTIDAEVFVSNIGKSDANGIAVTLYYDAGSGWVPFDCVENPKFIDLPARKFGTVNFTCYTGSMGYTYDPGGAPYPVKAEAIISGDDDTTNDKCTDEFNLFFQNVAIIDVTNTTIVSVGVEIDVKVMNKGTANASSVPVFVSYTRKSTGETKPISDVWCERMAIAFDLLFLDIRKLTFWWTPPSEYWSNQADYYITAIISPLQHETSITDNVWPGGRVNPVDLSVSIDPTTPELDIVQVHKKKMMYFGDLVSMIYTVTVYRTDTYSYSVDAVVYFERTNTEGKTMIKYTELFSIVAGGSYPTTFTWTEDGTIAKEQISAGNWTISAGVAVVYELAYDEDPIDNLATDGTVEAIEHRTDINGDGKVRVDDVLKCALAFGSAPGHEKWNPDCDLTGDGKVRVDDLLKIALDFGKTFPFK